MFFQEWYNLHYPNSDYQSANLQKINLGMAATDTDSSYTGLKDWKYNYPEVNKIFPGLKLFEGFQESYLNICGDSKIFSEVWKLSHVSCPWSIKVGM